MMERSRSSPDIIGILKKQDRELAERISKLWNRELSIPDWITPTLLGSWVNFGGAEEPAGYWRSSSGLVLLRGTIRNGIIPSAVWIMPEGFRPLTDKHFPIVSAGSFGYALVQANGNVVVPAGNSSSVYLSGIVYRAEQ